MLQKNVLVASIFPGYLGPHPLEGLLTRRQGSRRHVTFRYHSWVLHLHQMTEKRKQSCQMWIGINYAEKRKIIIHFTSVLRNLPFTCTIRVGNTDMKIPFLFLTIPLFHSSRIFWSVVAVSLCRPQIMTTSMSWRIIAFLELRRHFLPQLTWNVCTDLQESF